MKSRIELIEIAGQEFSANEEATRLVRQLKKTNSKKYRFEKKTKRELNSALRDILLDKTNAGRKPITKKVAEESIALVGDNFEGRNRFGRTKSLLSKIFVYLKSSLRVDKYGKFFLGLLLLPIFLGFVLSVRSLVYKPYNYPYPNSNGSNLNTSELGQTTFGSWYKVISYNQNPFEPYNTGKQLLFVFAITCGLFSLAIFLALRKKQAAKWFFLVGIIGVVFICVFSAADNQNRRQFMSNAEAYLVAPLPKQKRNWNDFDTLWACGNAINLVSGDQAGSLYYGLKDRGYVLYKELQNATRALPPSRQTICATYNELRQKYSNDSIVIQSYNKNAKGEIVPIDYDQYYGPYATTYYSGDRQVYYGFFVLSSGLLNK